MSAGLEKEACPSMLGSVFSYFFFSAVLCPLRRRFPRTPDVGIVIVIDIDRFELRERIFILSEEATPHE